MPWLPALLVVAAALIIGGWGALRMRAWLQRWRGLRITRRAAAGETRARAWLERNGFSILGEQVALTCEMRVDGERVAYEVCADFVVERGGERGIVEVKTAGAANPSSPATRRQIFEYAAVYGVNRAYMFDGDQSRLHEIVFQAAPPRGPAPRRRLASWQAGFISGVLVAAAVAWAIMR